ncbi:MFS general substrate transporter [Aureobasidium namibiae CBS 147.97]|uniref:MFS general substrate transporter n=1 Tax=Aureobasidium namibiae CBS 147.97 TaxID=1043004 RepID=A0A074XLK0_9PEZI
MPTCMVDGSKEHRNRIDALSVQLSRASTLVEQQPDTTALHAQFEGRELYDYRATWTFEEESKVKLKTDIRLLGWLSIMFFAAQLDSTNISNALADNFLHDLGFTMTEYGNGTMIHRICFLIGGLPSQMIAMRYGYRYLLSGLLCASGAVAWTQAWMQSAAGFYFTRGLIGLLEGGFGPLTVMCLSNFYTNKELGFRIAILSSGINIARALSTLLAAGLLTMRGTAGRPGWFWLILINGLLIFVIGLASIFYLPSGPTRTQTVLWRKPWFTKREQMIAINRLLRDDASKGRTGSKTRASMRDIWNTFKDPGLIGFWFCAMIIYIPKSPVSQYLVLSLRQLDFSRFESNVLTMPSDFIRVITILTLTRSSGHFKEKAFHCTIPNFIEIPLFATLLLLPSYGYAWVRFAILTLIIGTPSSHPIIVSWISCNSFDPKKRGIAIALFGTIHEIGSFAAAYNDKPYYYTGNKVLISICAASVVVILTHREVLKHIDRNKKKAWENLSEIEQRDYDRVQGSRSGNKSLTFSFGY